MIKLYDSNDQQIIPGVVMQNRDNSARVVITEIDISGRVHAEVLRLPLISPTWESQDFIQAWTVVR